MPLQNAHLNGAKSWKSAALLDTEKPFTARKWLHCLLLNELLSIVNDIRNREVGTSA